jgi:DNA-binding phage protein
VNTKLPFEIPDNTPIDEAFIEEANTKLSQVSKQMVSDKMEEAKLMQASIADGGPSSINEALSNLISYCGLTVRSLSKKANISRTKLQRMVDGRLTISPEDNDKMEQVFRSIKPNLYNF